jgi:hypothetical protein
MGWGSGMQESGKKISQISGSATLLESDFLDSPESGLVWKYCSTLDYLRI